MFEHHFVWFVFFQMLKTVGFDFCFLFKFFNHVLSFLNIHVFRCHILAEVWIKGVELVDVSRGHLVFFAHARSSLLCEIGQFWLQANVMSHICGWSIYPEIFIHFLLSLRSIVRGKFLVKVARVQKSSVLKMLVIIMNHSNSLNLCKSIATGGNQKHRGYHVVFHFIN